LVIHNSYLLNNNSNHRYNQEYLEILHIKTNNI
jgi:hypothetical protein